MKFEDFKLTIIEFPDGIYTASLDSFKGIIIQTNDIKDVPKQIAKSLEVMLMYGFDKGIHEIIKYKQ